MVVVRRNCFMAVWILIRITQVSQYQKGETNLDFTEAREWVVVVSAGPYATKSWLIVWLYGRKIKLPYQYKHSLDPLIDKL